MTSRPTVPELTGFYPTAKLGGKADLGRKALEKIFGHPVNSSVGWRDHKQNDLDDFAFAG